MRNIGMSRMLASLYERKNAATNTDSASRIYPTGIAMEVRQLRYFLAVAEHGSIAAASRILHVAQPALSRQIAELEMQLDSQLFKRLPRGVSLTRSGQELVLRALEIIDKTTKLKDQIRLAENGRVGTLRLGVLPGYSWLPKLGDTISALTDNSPGVRVTIESGLSINLLAAMKEDRLDMAVVVWRSPLDSTLTGRVIHRDKMGLAMLKSLPEANKPNLQLRDLSHYNFIMFARERSPSYFDVLMRTLTQAGIVPRGSPVASDSHNVIGLIAAGLGCAVVPLSYRHFCPEQVVIHEIEGLDLPLEIELVWRADRSDPLVELVLELFASTESSGPLPG